MKIHAIFPISLISSLITLTPAARSAVYYVDSATGDDEAAGTEQSQPWRSLEKVNHSPLLPGDRVLFKSGGRWSGQLKPMGSGSDEKWILIGRYGEGPAPRIDGEGKVQDTVLIQNQSFIELADLQVTNQGPSPAPWRTGVHLIADGIGRMRQVSLLRLHVHDVNGDLRKSHEGCGIYFEATRKNDSHFDGLLIEDCRVVRTDRNGICQRGTGKQRSRNVIIRGNVLEDIGGDGIKLWGTDGGLIERNVVRKARARCNEKEAAAGIWPFACDDTIIQFNEVSGTLGTRDGQGFDSDYWCRRTVIQYNYSHQNEGGFLLVCSPENAINDDTIIRYNVSVHDGLNSARVFHFGGGARRTHVYNNTIIVGAHQDLPMMLFTEWDGGKAANSRFSNNLFIVEDGGRATYQFGSSSGNLFENNHFAGRHDGLPAGVEISRAPKLAGPLTPAPGFASLNAFRPLHAGGVTLGRPIANHGGRDITGKPVPIDQPPAVGALQP